MQFFTKLWNFDFEARTMIWLLAIIGAVGLGLDVSDLIRGFVPKGHIPFLIPGAMAFWAIIVYAVDQWFKKATPADKQALKERLEKPLV